MTPGFCALVATGVRPSPAAAVLELQRAWAESDAAGKRKLLRPGTAALRSRVLRLELFLHLVAGFQGERLAPGLARFVRLFEGGIDIAEMVEDGRVRLLG
jgi:hypothetical protein